MENDYHPSFHFGFPPQGYLLGPLQFVIYIDEDLNGEFKKEDITKTRK